MRPTLPKRTNSVYAPMPMPVPCLPVVVFVALRLPMTISYVYAGSAFVSSVFVTMPTPMRPCLCAYAYVPMPAPVPRLPANCYGGHPKLHGMPAAMAKESMFEVDAVTVARPMPMPMRCLPMPMSCSCLLPFSPNTKKPKQMSNDLQNPTLNLPRGPYWKPRGVQDGIPHGLAPGPLATGDRQPWGIV